MVSWPTADQLKDHVRFALDAVATRNRVSLILGCDWTADVFVEIKDRLTPLGLECQALKNRKQAQSKGFKDTEFIYDFTANIYDDKEDEFLIQTVVAGESEWHARDIEEWDF